MNIPSPGHPPQPPAGGAVAGRSAIIRLAGVGKQFPARKDGQPVEALSDIDLDVPAGSVLGVIGRSGAGKSTLIRLVNGLEKPTSGQVIVDGVDVSRLPENKLRAVRRNIGMIFQHFNLLSSRTVFDNIALPLEVEGAAAPVIRERVERLMSLVGLDDKRSRYPAELSGGQKQRVGIARALATNPKVLLSDEATSALDPETTHSILSLLSAINRELGVTILLITHEMAVIRAIAQQMAVLDGGRVVEQGDVFDVFTRPQHPTTRSFLAAETGRAPPSFVADRLAHEDAPGMETVIRIIFRGRFATHPVLAQVSRELDIDVNILGGTIDAIGGKPFGVLIVGVPGGRDLSERFVSFLAARDLDTEVLGYVPASAFA
ncbi:methionine ABC transporter ATP-binding protein [Pseudochelatococcus lubricantis]|nr:methionine ABC transporter ATP-binding protein [Pseudochelatococcus lubricantis]